MSYRVHEPLVFRLLVVLVLTRFVGRPAKDVGPESLALLIGTRESRHPSRKKGKVITLAFCQCRVSHPRTMREKGATYCSIRCPVRVSIMHLSHCRVFQMRTRGGIRSKIRTNGRRKINRDGRGLPVQGQEVPGSVYGHCDHKNIRLAER